MLGIETVKRMKYSTEFKIEKYVCFCNYLNFIQM